MSTSTYKKPVFRRLHAYAFDPSLSLDIDTANINKLVYEVPWEDLEYPGPIGEYLEVIDYDPTIGRFFTPVDLNLPYILAENGLAPSESNPHFHQQMVYAVAMITIKNFEKALGRKILWSTRLLNHPNQYEAYVQRLRIYPHALREANAYYSPLKKALLFGYFSSTPADAVTHMPGSLVFTCLSHDIIAHEVTHAILDGMHRNYNNPTNPDVLAFHEAFADIVALFQHFTFPEVLRHQIARTRGDLSSENLLGQLAQELGSAIGSYGSLRDAIGETDQKTGKWRPKKPDPSEYSRVMEPHQRGSILVAAIFEAFISIYKNRTADLLRIATNGTGILPQGDLHPDLVNRLSVEAAKTAKYILLMCIRALDYCPPIDITFGDYLRAIITSDLDLVSVDRRDYRLALITAFRNRGIYPTDIKTLSIESLSYKELNIGLGEDDEIVFTPPYYQEQVEEPDPTDSSPGDIEKPYKVDDGTAYLLAVLVKFLRAYGESIQYINDRKEIYEITKKFIIGDDDSEEGGKGDGLHDRIEYKFDSSIDFSKITGLLFDRNFKELGLTNTRGNPDFPSFQILNMRLVSRVGPEGSILNHVVFSIIQNSGIMMEAGKKIKHFEWKEYLRPPEKGFLFQGGCTLIFDLDTLKLKYAISKPLIDLEHLENHLLNEKDHNRSPYKINEKRVKAQYQFQFEAGALGINPFARYFNTKLPDNCFVEPFALLHSH